MASEDRTATATLAFIRELEETPYGRDFFQTLRRIEALNTRTPRLGETVRPTDDPIRLGQEPSMAFAPSVFSNVALGTDGRPPRLSVLFLGLFGPNGPLPLHLTEYARQRMRNENDSTVARFADVFHHRFLSLFYRAWANSQPTVSYDRPEKDRFSNYVGSFFGLGMSSLRGRDAMPDRSKLHFGGLLSDQTRNASGLQSILKSFFQVPVRVLQFIGHWIDLPPESHWRLGAPEGGALGKTTTIGSRVWDCQQKFRVEIGPMGFEQYRRLLPGAEGSDRLVAIVRNYVGDQLDWDVNLILRREEVPRFRLGESGQLGWTSWAAAEPLPQDADAAVFAPMEHLAVL